MDVAVADQKESFYFIKMPLSYEAIRAITSRWRSMSDITQSNLFLETRSDGLRNI